MPFGSPSYQRYLEQQISALVRAYNLLHAESKHIAEGGVEKDPHAFSQAWHYIAAAEQYRHARINERRRNREGMMTRSERYNHIHEGRDDDTRERTVATEFERREP